MLRRNAGLSLCDTSIPEPQKYVKNGWLGYVSGLRAIILPTSGVQVLIFVAVLILLHSKNFLGQTCISHGPKKPQNKAKLSRPHVS